METNNQFNLENQPKNWFVRNLLLLGMILSLLVLGGIGVYAIQNRNSVSQVASHETQALDKNQSEQEIAPAAKVEEKIDPILAEPQGDFDEDGMTNSFELENGYNPKKDEKKEAPSVNLSSCENLQDTQVGVLGKSFSISQTGQCTRVLARSNDNVFVCDRIEATITRGTCYMDFSQLRKNPKICERSAAFDSPTMCYFNLAAVLDQPEICDKIGKVDNMSYSKQECYKKAAQFRKDISLCEKIEVVGSGQTRISTSSIKAQCHSYFAHLNKDLNHCATAQKLSSLDGDGCYQNLGPYMKDLSVCNNIQSQGAKTNCIYTTNQVLAGKMSCSTITMDTGIYDVSGKKYRVPDILCS